MDEARNVTDSLFGTRKNLTSMQGAWSKLEPSRKADMADGVAGIGTGPLNKDTHEFYVKKKELEKTERSERFQEFKEIREMEKEDINVKDLSKSTKPMKYSSLLHSSKNPGIVKK